MQKAAGAAKIYKITKLQETQRRPRLGIDTQCQTTDRDVTSVDWS